MVGTKGSFEEVIGRIYDLYMGSRVKDIFIKRYLFNLRDEKAEYVFSMEDVDKLFKMLQRDREETKMVTYSKEKHWCIACGRETYINLYGFCAECWGAYVHLRESKGAKEPK